MPKRSCISPALGVVLLKAETMPPALLRGQDDCPFATIFCGSLPEPLEKPAFRAVIAPNWGEVRHG
jgi:hypothetical protein